MGRTNSNSKDGIQCRWLKFGFLTMMMTRVEEEGMASKQQRRRGGRIMPMPMSRIQCKRKWKNM
jgi:hypothetical protein